MIEVELKFAVDSLENLRDQFSQIGASFVSRSVQTDEYLNDPLRDFGKLDLALRIRSCDGKYCVTFKGPKLDPTAKIRKEIEMPLVDEASAEQMKGIFGGIGLLSVTKVVKQREQMQVDWLDEKVEICLDDVVDVGHFVELELVVADSQQVAAAKQKLFSLADHVGLSGPIQTSYLQMLLTNRGMS